MKLTDDVLNKYIDRELSAAEVRELKEIIANDPGSLEKLKALQLADDILRELEFDAAPQNFTEKLMSRLNVAYSTAPQKNYFIKIVFALFGLGFLGIFGFGISQASLDSSDKSDNFLLNIFDTISEFTSSVNLSFSISSNLMMLIISALVLITLVAAYIIINSHKSFKESIEHLSH